MRILAAKLQKSLDTRLWLCPSLCKGMPDFKNNASKKRLAGLNDSIASVVVKITDLGDLGRCFPKNTPKSTFYAADKAMNYARLMSCSCSSATGTNCDVCTVVMTA